MDIKEISIVGYRSVKALHLPLRRVNVVVGPNGCGKSNLYRAIHLLARAASGHLAQTMALEGGVGSAMWAGPRMKGEKRIKLGVEYDSFAFRMELGLPIPTTTKFELDPVIKEEYVSVPGPRGSQVNLLERKAGTVWLRDAEGARADYPFALSLSESALAQIRDPQRYPELTHLHLSMSSWRFYHHFRTDEHSPLRAPRLAVRTPILAHDGGDLVCALQNIIETGDEPGLRRSIDMAFPGAELIVDSEARGHLFYALKFPSIQRPFDARELSDGQLRFLCLLAALKGVHAAPLIALNEPETSLHPDLIPALASLIVEASERSQIWVTTHSQALADAIERKTGEAPMRVTMRDGETIIQKHRPSESDD